MKTKPTLLETEMRLLTTDAGNMSLEDFTNSLWCFLNGNKAAVRSYARTLNVYPTLGNVYHATVNYLTT